MRAADPGRLPAEVDHCAVHQFIRVHGRRPTAEELADGLTGPDRTGAPAPDPARASQPGALRREVARLIHRL